MASKLSPYNLRSRSLNRMHNRYFITLFLFLILVSFPFVSVNAYNFPPDPPPYLVNQNIRIVISATSPTKVVVINVTKYSPQQFLKSITIEFSEPITFTSFIISLLSDKPPNLCAPNSTRVLQYYYIRTYVEMDDKIRNITMIFTIDKSTIRKRDIREDDLTVYRSHGQEFKKCHVVKILKDDLIYLDVKTEGLGYFAVAGAASISQKITIITLMTLIIVPAVILFLRRKFLSRRIFRSLWRKNLHEH
jgi:PGF-pre-PGF domain-containing protein